MQFLRGNQQRHGRTAGHSRHTLILLQTKMTVAKGDKYGRGGVV